jgi:hypothetical protein
MNIEKIITGQRIANSINQLHLSKPVNLAH